MHLVSKSTTFMIIVRLVIHVILIVNVCSHIYDFYNHICNYNVDITKWSHKSIMVCDYYIFGWKSKMKVQLVIQY